MSGMTMVVPMAIRRRGGPKQIIGPDGAPRRASGDAGETRGDPTLVKAMARAFRWLLLLEEGQYAWIPERAAKEGVDRTYIGRLLNLALLAPDLIEAVVDGRDMDGLSLRGFLGADAPIWTGRPLAAGYA